MGLGREGGGSWIEGQACVLGEERGGGFFSRVATRWSDMEVCGGFEGNVRW